MHRAVTKSGTPVAVKVQRAGLKELFDVDLKNLKKLAELLDKFDPKSDGADRSYNEIFDESANLLYKEIDYLNEARNARRFADDFADDAFVRTPDVLFDLSTEKVLTMEFVESFKLTDVARVEAAGLDRGVLAKRAADSFLAQIINTGVCGASPRNVGADAETLRPPLSLSGYFHCDPHPGNLCVNAEGQLIYYDYGMMDELKPNVKAGFKEFCYALFGGGPYIDDLQASAGDERRVSPLALFAENVSSRLRRTPRRPLVE